MTLQTEPTSLPGPARRPLSPVAARLLASARKEWEQRQFEAAERSITSVLALAPDDPDAIRMLGLAAQRRGDHATAIDCFRRALPTWPEDSDLRVGLGIALYEQGEIDEAMTHLRHACQLAPGSSSAWFNLGEALWRQAHAEEAVAALQRALELHPAHISARLSLARTQTSLGQIDAAVAGFRGVLRLDPGNAEGWFGLSNLNTVRFDAADAACLQRALARRDLSDRHRELLSFTLAKALEDQDDYAQAFEVFRLANASRRKRVKWDSAGEHRRVDAILRTFANATPPPLDAQLGHETILIVSPPRSGSTLVEQILASHPEVEGANEIKDLPQVIDAETRRRGLAFPLWGPDATAQDWQRLGNEYLARTARWRETKPRFTDKNLMNWYLVGAALAMLPAARVVIVWRDPVETCLACFRQCFTGDVGFACDLDELADYCIDFLRLKRFWLEKYPSRVFDLSYEALVAEPEPVIRRLLDFCGLPFDPACLDFHQTSRTVLSAPSAAQVRQPLRGDTARSARYGDKLDLLRERLMAAGVPIQPPSPSR
ncbi:sulfotransferase family protein [Rhodanobacter glycinis]|uniref:Sulfotransferase family protein n=1 Tax=Rhodanobacter glycinis TaxID=582702 RepID=A0A502BWS9_9GAMM|nr:sulfotransferase family protein [Rhodanobacter glycinis]TPG04970.1 sulfotransferase family protein [Rhodanobacter glycinis]